MTGEQLKAVHEARPFKPFSICLADGTSVEVRHPEMLFRTQGGRTIIVNTSGENLEILDLLLVTKLVVGNGPKKRRGG
jgi:hypothetical protein